MVEQLSSMFFWSLNCTVLYVINFPGAPAYLVMAVTGLGPDEEATFSHATLLGPQGEALQQVKLNSSSSSSTSYSVDELVGLVESVPRIPFSIRLTGRDGRGNTLERVSTEMVQPTHVQIQVGTVHARLSCPSLSCWEIEEFVQTLETLFKN